MFADTVVYITLIITFTNVPTMVNISIFKQENQVGKSRENKIKRYLPLPP